MDKHLNLFYSYNQGNSNSLERAKQLENNLTRALISTLQNLSKNVQHAIISKMVNGEKLNSKDFTFDLQDTSKEYINKKAQKFLLILQRDKSDISKLSFEVLHEK